MGGIAEERDERVAGQEIGRSEQGMGSGHGMKIMPLRVPAVLLDGLHDAGIQRAGLVPGWRPRHESNV